MILTYKGISPKIGKNVFIAPTSVVIGNVTIGDNANIWFNAILRGDMEFITIGDNTNIQDNCTVHTDHNCPVVVGANVTIGHNAIIHGCSIENDVLIGMGSTILNNASIKKFSVVAAGSVVLEKQLVGPYHLVAGSPAKHKKNLNHDIKNILNKSVKDYLNLSKNYKT